VKVTGYQLREATRKFELQRDTAARLFKSSLYAFEDEVKEDPIEVMDHLKKAELSVVRLQEAQQKYNLKVLIDVQGKSITLAAAVKMLGGAGRIAKMWREAVADKEDRYGYRNERERNKDTEVARKRLPFDVALKEANTADGFAGALRAAIAVGNATSLEIEGLDTELFE
jgi:hypothetical protein